MEKLIINPKKMAVQLRKIEAQLDECLANLAAAECLVREKSFSKMDKKLKNFAAFFVAFLLLLFQLTICQLDTENKRMKRNFKKTLKEAFVALVNMAKNLSALPKIKESLLRGLIASVDEQRKMYPSSKHESYLSELMAILVYRAEAAAKEEAADSIPGLKADDEE